VATVAGAAANESQHSEARAGQKFVEGAGTGASGVEHAISGTRDVLGSAATLQKAAERLSGMKSVPDSVVRGAWGVQDRAATLTGRADIQALKRAADSKTAGGILTLAKWAGAVAEGTSAYQAAMDRGVGKTAASLDAAAAGAAKFIDSGWKATAVEAAYMIAKAISPHGAQYLKPVADLSPGTLVKDGAISTIDTISALVSSDTKRAIATHENRLSGGYDGPIRILAIAADFAAAKIMHDERGVSELSDMAAGGQLGSLAQVGDHIGSWAFDITHRHR
jgi:hypothetical protein